MAVNPIKMLKTAFAEGYGKNTGKLLSKGATAGLGTKVAAGLWTAAEFLSPIARTIMDMMQFSAIMNTQEMITDLQSQVEELKFRSPQFNKQLEDTRRIIDNENDSLAKSISGTERQLKSLGKVETNIKVINGKPIDSIMYGLDVNIDDTLSNKYQLSGSDTQLMNSPNVGFNELAKVTLNSKEEIINEIRNARNDSTKKLNRNARMISNAGKLSGVNLKYNQEKLEGLDEKLDLMYNSLSNSAQYGLTGTSAIVNLMDSEKEEPKEKSLSEKLGEMYAKITTFPQRIAVWGAKMALGVLAAGASAKLIYSLISGDDSGDPNGLDWSKADLALEEFRLRDSGKYDKETEIQDALRTRFESLRWENANKQEGYNGGVYNYVNDERGRWHTRKDENGNESKVFLDNQTLSQIGDFYNMHFNYTSRDENLYKGALCLIPQLISKAFILFSPRSLSARIQACITINMSPEHMKKVIDNYTGNQEFKALQDSIEKHTNVFADKVLVPTVMYFAKTLTDLMFYGDKEGENPNLIYFDKEKKIYGRVSFYKLLDAWKVKADQKDIVRNKINKIIIAALLGSAPKKYYVKHELYGDSTEIIKKRTDGANQVKTLAAGIITRAAEGTTKGIISTAVVGTGVSLGCSKAFGIDNPNEATHNATGSLAGAIAYEGITGVLIKDPVIGALVGCVEYLINVGLDYYKASKEMDYYLGMLDPWKMGEEMSIQYGMHDSNNNGMDIFGHALTDTASSALLARTLMFYKECCRAYMQSYQAAYSEKGKNLYNKGDVDFRDGFYYKKGTNDLMSFSLNDAEDERLFNESSKNTGSFLNNFNSLYKSYKDPEGVSLLSKNIGNWLNDSSKYDRWYDLYSTSTRNVGEQEVALGNASQFINNLGGVFRAGEKLELKDLVSAQGNIVDKAYYSDDYVEPDNVDSGPNGKLTEALFNGMNGFVKKQLGEDYKGNKHIVRVNYTSGTRDYPMHKGMSKWDSYHQYGLAVDVGLNKLMKTINKDSSENNIDLMKELTRDINDELERNKLGYYKVVLEPNSGGTGYHLHIINGRPFIEGKLPKLKNKEYVKNFQNLINKTRKDDWTQFKENTKVYYDKSKIEFSDENREKLISAKEGDFENTEGIGDSNENLNTTFDKKLDKIAQLVLANSMKMDATNILVGEVYSKLGITNSSIVNLANSNKTVVPGTELLNTDSRSL